MSQCLPVSSSPSSHKVLCLLQTYALTSSIPAYPYCVPFSSSSLAYTLSPGLHLLTSLPSPKPASVCSHRRHASSASCPVPQSHFHSWSTHLCPTPSVYTLWLYTSSASCSRRDLPDTEGWLPASTCTLQDSPEFKLYRENQRDPKGLLASRAQHRRSLLLPLWLRLDPG